MKDFIGRTMNEALHPQLASQFVWAGRLTKKFAFKALELKNVPCGKFIEFLFVYVIRWCMNVKISNRSTYQTCG